MRRTTGRPLLAALAGMVLMVTAAPAVAGPDDTNTPSREDVAAAQEAARDKRRDVAAVQADLVLANQRLEGAAVRAAQAAEAYNAARWRLAEAKREAQRAAWRAERADARLTVHERLYADVLAASYEMSPEIATISAIVQEDGIDGVVERANTMYAVTSSMDEIQAGFEAAEVVAEMAGDEAAEARQAAQDLEAEAAAAREAAQAQEHAALAEAERVTSEKDSLIAELAELQDISVGLATERQAALERAAQERAARAAQAKAEADAAAEAEAAEAAATPAAAPQPQPEPEPQPQPQDESTQQPQPEPQPEPAPQPDPTPPTPSASGAQRAIAFARDQIGEPYQWGADGPGSWDCSGLTMKAWDVGGRYLPHYSVAQYDTSTPIRASQLQPGDLVFWGSSSRPSSIYHVALYAGGGRIIHAPRTGRPVTEESMYYWIPPNFFARP